MIYNSDLGAELGVDLLAKRVQDVWLAALASRCLVLIAVPPSGHARPARCRRSDDG